jgi:hypothetical protein
MIDAIVCVAYLVVANPSVTGLAVHEWAGTGVLVVFVVHTAVNLDAVLAVLRRQASRAGVANIVLDAALLVAFMVATVSGIMVSRHILPALGFVAPGYFFWNPLHSISAKVVLALLVVHIVAHIRWLLSLTGKGRQDDHDPAGQATGGRQDA